MAAFLMSVVGVISAFFSRYGLCVQAVVVLVTVLLVMSGLDWTYYEATRNTAFLSIVLFAGIAGFIVPIIGPLAIFLSGRGRSETKMLPLAQDVAVAEVSAFLMAAAYKAFTGRLQPNLANGADISHAFQFGILKNGIFWGWPSSHTIVAFAGVFVVVLAVRSRIVRILSMLYAAVIGFGASVGFHWLSDVIAGALLGALVAFNTHRDSRATGSLQEAATQAWRYGE